MWKGSLCLCHVCPMPASSFTEKRENVLIYGAATWYEQRPASIQTWLCVSSVPSRIHTHFPKRSPNKIWIEINCLCVTPHHPVHIPRYKFPSLPNQSLPALTPHLSVIPGSLVLRGPQTCQTSSSPSKKYPSSRHNPPVPPPTSPPSLLGPPNKNKVTVKREWPGLLLCRSVSGYLIVTHGLGP